MKRTKRYWIWMIAWIACFAIAAAAQDPSVALRGPVLGFLEDSAAASIRPILGIPGASFLGPPLVIDHPVRTVVISPKQDYALGVLGDSDAVSLLQFNSGPATFRSIDGVLTGVDVIVTSPTGSSAAVFDRDSKAFQSIVELTGTPRPLFEFDASGIRGTLESMAITDDGMFAMLNFVDEGTAELWIFTSNGDRWMAPAVRPSAIAFLPRVHDAVVADSGAREVFLLRGTPPEARLSLKFFGDGFDSISAVAASEDGRQVVVVSPSSGNITLIDVESRLSTEVLCYCKPTGLDRLKGTAVFRVSSPSGGPIFVLDASAAEPRIVVMPLESSSNE